MTYGATSLRSARATARATDPHQPPHPRPRGARHRRDGEMLGVMTTHEALRARPGAGARPRRGQPQGRAAGLQDPRLRQVQVRREEEGARGQAQADRRRDQRDQAPPEDRRARYRLQDPRGSSLPRGRQQGEVHRALPRPRDHAPREGAGAARHRSCSECEDIANVEVRPMMEGRTMTLLIAPKPAVMQKVSQLQGRRREGAPASHQRRPRVAARAGRRAGRRGR